MNEAEQENDLPRRIVERLAARERAVAVVTPRVDAAIARSAAAHFAARPDTAHGVGAPGHGLRAVGLGWAAVAAALLVALLVVRPIGDVGRDAALVADDIDGSGRVDILDAFALARMRATRAQISQAEIDALAARIVSLQGARRTL